MFGKNGGGSNMFRKSLSKEEQTDDAASKVDSYGEVTSKVRSIRIAQFD